MLWRENHLYTTLKSAVAASCVLMPRLAGLKEMQSDFTNIILTVHVTLLSSYPTYECAAWTSTPEEPENHASATHFVRHRRCAINDLRLPPPQDREPHDVCSEGWWFSLFWKLRQGARRGTRSSGCKIAASHQHRANEERETAVRDRKTLLVHDVFVPRAPWDPGNVLLENSTRVLGAAVSQPIAAMWETEIPSNSVIV